MDTIQKLTQAGEREEAARMLALLQNMLENMHMVQGNGSGAQQQSARSKQLNDAISKLGDLMGKQRSLLDKTFRQQQGQANPADGGAQGLAKQQQNLEQQLQDALKGRDPKLADKMKNGGQAMDESKNALQHGNLEGASNAQKNALQALSQAAQELARAMKENGRSCKPRSAGPCQ